MGTTDMAMMMMMMMMIIIFDLAGSMP